MPTGVICSSCTSATVRTSKPPLHGFSTLRNRCPIRNPSPSPLTFSSAFPLYHLRGQQTTELRSLPACRPDSGTSAAQASTTSTAQRLPASSRWRTNPRTLQTPPRIRFSSKARPVPRRGPHPYTTSNRPIPSPCLVPLPQPRRRQAGGRRLTQHLSRNRAMGCYQYQPPPASLQQPIPQLTPPVRLLPLVNAAGQPWHADNN